MSLTVNEHYAASAACFVGGTLSVVTHLWLLFDFLPQIRFPKALRSLHVQLAIGNLMAVCFFFFGAVSHFEQGWIFGDRACSFYIFWCKFCPIAVASVLAVCLYGEHQYGSDSSLENKNVTYTGLSLIAWAYGLLWGVLALTWAQSGQEPAGFTCTVLWYKIQPYVTYMSSIGFGLPMAIACYQAYGLWSKGLLSDNPAAKTAKELSLRCGRVDGLKELLWHSLVIEFEHCKAEPVIELPSEVSFRIAGTCNQRFYVVEQAIRRAAVCLLISVNVQFGGYACGYIAVWFGYGLSLHYIAFAQIWTKSLAVVHPFIYSQVFARPPISSTDKQD